MCIDCWACILTNECSPKMQRVNWCIILCNAISLTVCTVMYRSRAWHCNVQCDYNYIVYCISVMCCDVLWSCRLIAVLILNLHWSADNTYHGGYVYGQYGDFAWTWWMCCSSINDLLCLKMSRKPFLHMNTIWIDSPNLQCKAKKK